LKFDYSYNHHFLVTDATNLKLTILHHAPKRISNILLLTGVAEIIQEIVDVENDKETLDFESGVFLVTADNYPKTPSQRLEAVRQGKKG
jgi:hypothetical protein